MGLEAPAVEKAFYRSENRNGTDWRTAITLGESPNSRPHKSGSHFVHRCKQSISVLGVLP